MAFSNDFNRNNEINGINGLSHDERAAWMDYEENGHSYHLYKKGKYPFPCGEPELDRLDCFNKFFLVARKDERHRVPLDPNAPLRILDLGCGTGIWAIEMAANFPNAEVWGVDICPKMQPASMMANNRFLAMDMDSEEGDSWRVFNNPDKANDWVKDFKHAPFDMIHLRTLVGSIASWPRLYSQIYHHLTPGHGYIEQVEVDWYPCNDEGPVSERLMLWANEVLDAMDRSGRSMRVAPRLTRQMLASAGFVDFDEVVIRVPVNGAYYDLHQVDIGRWFNLGLHKGLEGLTMGPLTRFKGWTPEEVRMLKDDVLREIGERENKSYFKLYIWTARKPRFPPRSPA